MEEKILKLKKEKNAIILAHYYQNSEIQDIADYIGDSLGLSQKAAETEADIIVFAGVNFMAETAKILSPSKKVLIPDAESGCSLAESCPAADFKAFKEKHPDHTVVTYVNTSADIKALSDISCTSSNAVKIVDSLPKDEKIIFAPDRNLGNYINGVTGRNMVLWDGACHVHEEFSVEKILELKKQHPDAEILVHPECAEPVRIIADKLGSTSELLNHSIKSDCTKFIVATESGILHQMQKECKNKTFIPAPPNDSTCACNDCKYMKLVTLEKLYNCLKDETPEVILDEQLISEAQKPIIKMLDLSKNINK